MKLITGAYAIMKCKINLFWDSISGENNGDYLLDILKREKQRKSLQFEYYKL